MKRLRSLALFWITSLTLFKVATIYNNIFWAFVNAEMIKLFRNCFLATKVAFCNEIHQFCSLQNVNYENVRKLATLDERITPSHSFVPGKDGHFGFGGTCFPKDISNLRHEMNKKGMRDMESVRNVRIIGTKVSCSQDNGRGVIIDSCG